MLLWRPILTLLVFSSCCSAATGRNLGRIGLRFSVRASSPKTTPSPRATNARGPPETYGTHKYSRPIRGGGGGAKAVVAPECDSNAMVAAKTAANAALETAGLLGLTRAAELAAPKLNEWLGRLKIPTSVMGLPVLQWVSAVFVIFSSSTVTSWIKGGISAATNQALKPNVVPGDSDWYGSLKKPWFNPPGWVFPIMWLIVSKPTQLVAVSKMLKQSPVPYWPVLTVYCTHLSLGDAWNEVFFGCQRVGLGAYVIATFYALLLTSTKLIYDLDETAGRYMLPTCGWVTVATALNLSIYGMNRN